MPIGSGLSAQLGLAEETYTNAVQTLTGAAGGTFTLTFEGATTTILQSTETAVNIQNALNALPNIGAAGVACSGGPLGTGAVTVTFGGNPLTAKRAVGLLVSSIDLTHPVIAMATPGVGYGNYVAPTRFLEFADENLFLGIDRMETATLRPANQVLRSDRWYPNKRGVTGDVTLEVASKGFGLILKHMLGPAGFAITIPTNGVLTRRHRAQLADPFNTSLTLQVGRPDTGGTVRPFSFVGCKITDWELDSELDKILSLKLTFDGKDEDQSQALGAASYAAAFELLHFGEGQIQIGGANFDVRKFNLKAKRGLKTDRYFLRNDTRKKEPILNMLAEITGDIEAEFTDLSAYNRFVNGQLASIVATWTGSQIEAVTPTYFNQLVVTLPAVRFDGQSPDIAGADVITQSLPFKVVNDSSALGPITIDLFTTDTTA